MKITCPACQSTHVTRAPDQNRFDVTDSFRVFPWQRCADCGHQWEPPAPGWLLVLGTAVGAALLAFGIWLFASDPGRFWSRGLIVGMLGFSALWGCGRRLRAQRGKGGGG